jgi:hypothetical protein
MEYTAQNGWKNVWLESDSTSALLVFRNQSLVTVMLRNHWHNACSQGIQVISSHIFREGNYCTDLLANWVIHFRTRFGSLCYLRLCTLTSLWTEVGCLVIGYLSQLFSLFLFVFRFSFEGFGLVPPHVFLFPFF